MKLQVAGTRAPGFDDEEPPTSKRPYDSSPALEGLVQLVSEVRLRVAERAEHIAARRGPR